MLVSYSINLYTMYYWINSTPYASGHTTYYLHTLHHAAEYTPLFNLLLYVADTC